MEQNKIVINLESEDMDPKLVLFGGDDILVKIPIPDAKIFNNLDEYYKNTFMKKNQAHQANNASSSSSNSNLLTRDYSRFNLISNEMSTTVEKRKPIKQNRFTDVIQKMETHHGPLNVLYKSIGEKIKIFIRRKKLCQTKEERFVWCTGQLIAFDKHFNLILKNSIEIYNYTMKQTKQLKIINKQSKQLFIRGDNIILIGRL